MSKIISASRLYKIATIRESLPKIAKMLSAKNIPLFMRGERAYVNYNGSTGEPSYVVVPVIPDDASDQFLDAIQGFVDHEVGHLLFSDATVLFETPKKHKALANILEDVYIEKKMAQKFEGSRRNLSNTRNVFTSKYLMPRYEAMKSEGTAKQQEYWALLCAAALRALGGQPELEAFMKDKWDDIGDVLKRIEKFKGDIEALDSSEASLILAKKIHRAIYGKPEDEKPEDRDGEEPKDDDEGDGSPSSEKSDKDESVDDVGEEKDESEPEESAGEDEDEGEGEDEDEDGSEPEESEGEGEGESEEPEDEADLDGDGEDTKPDGDESESELDDRTGHGDVKTETLDDIPTEEEEEALFEESDEGEEEDFDEAMGKVLSEMASKEIENSDYVPYTTSEDVVERVNLDKTPPDNRFLKRAESELSQVIRPLTRSLERIFVAKNKSRFESGKRSGRIAPANLARLAADDDRVFRVKKEMKTKEIAVQIVIDCSGSMSGRKADLAAKTALALTEVLTRLKINFEVIGFTTCGYNREADGDDMRKYARSEKIYLPIFKSFGEVVTVETKQRISTIQGSLSLQQNIDGESIAMAATRLARQKEPGKTMIVLSDGSPCCMTGSYYTLETHLKKVIKSLERSGMNIIGFGILDDSPRRFYDKHVIVDKLEQLPIEVVSALSKIVTQAA